VESSTSTMIATILEGQLDHYDRTLKARADDYDYLNKLHGVAMQEVGRRFETSTAMSGLIQKQATEDLGLVGMEIQNSAGLLGTCQIGSARNPR
jgi:hypothetical protein